MASQVKRRACSSPARDELLAPADRLLDSRRDRLGRIGVDPDGRAAARVVQRRVRRDDRRRAARHRLDDGDSEALEPGREDEGLGAAVEPGQLLVRHVSEPAHAGALELDLGPPPGRAGDGEQEVAVEQPVRGEQRLQVLARLQRRHGEDVRLSQIGALALRPEVGAHAGRRQLDPLLRHVQQLGDIVAGIGRIDKNYVAGRGSVAVLGRVHRARARRRPLGMV